MTEASWLETSIMAKRGLAKGRSGKRHGLDIAAQGEFQYVYGRYAAPKLTIDPGDLVVVETEDAFGGVDPSEQDRPTEKLKFPFLNPQCGPIAVRGASKRRLPRRSHPRGGNPRRAARGEDLHHSGIRRPRRHRIDGAIE